MPEPALVAVAHGSTDPRASATIADLMAIARERAAERAARNGRPAPVLRTAYLGHAAPSLPQVLRPIEPDARVTVLPLLLTAAYHSKTDIPRELARTGPRAGRVSYGAPLGPHPLLLRALRHRLAEVDGTDPAEDRSRTGVVLAAAGSSDPEANATIARLAAQWQARDGWFAVRSAYASAASPAPAAAVAGLLAAGARRVVVASYLLAPGFFADRIKNVSLAAGAAAVSAVLGASAEVADVLLDRYEEQAGTRQRAAA
ncbi:MAG TPA: CbiX/SirB N-terminal domain-containing protein [Streptosporangiaceae bacterium]